MFETTEEDASAPGCLCPRCYHGLPPGPDPYHIAAGLDQVPEVERPGPDAHPTPPKDSEWGAENQEGGAS